jgi:hypothetical protein
MVKKVEQKSKKPAVVQASPVQSVLFPELSSKTNLQCRELLEDQILLIDVRFVAPCFCSPVAYSNAGFIVFCRV